MLSACVPRHRGQDDFLRAGEAKMCRAEREQPQTDKATGLWTKTFSTGTGTYQTLEPGPGPEPPDTGSGTGTGSLNLRYGSNGEGGVSTNVTRCQGGGEGSNSQRSNRM